MKANRMISFSLSMMGIAYLFVAIGSTLGQLREKPPHFCEDSSVQVQLERKRRFELPTLSLARRCSTTEPLPLEEPAKRCRGTDSNCRHRHFQCRALPPELPRQWNLLSNLRPSTVKKPASPIHRHNILLRTR